MSQPLIDNLPLIAAAPDGIKALRGLILDLAVRGKLVPQDPQDEPASELLKRIAAEKERLEKQGEIKKQAQLSDIVDDAPFRVQNGWAWTRLGAITSYIQRGKSPNYALEDGLPVVSQKCVQWRGLELSYAKMIVPESLAGYEPIRFLQDGDLLWNSTGTGTIGRVIRVTNPPDNLVCDSHVTVVRCLLVDSDYTRIWLASTYVYSQIEGRASGTTNQIELTAQMALNQPVPLPPLAEQRRIVAKVDELMALCDRLEAQQADAEAVHATLVKTLLDTLTQSQDADDFAANWHRLSQHFPTIFTTEASVDALKRTVLQLAAMGNIAHQNPDEEPADQLMARVSAEKASLVAEKKIKAEKPLPVVGKDERPYPLPKGWQWVRVGQYSLFTEYGTSEKTAPLSDGIPVLKMGDIQAGRVILGGQQRVPHGTPGIDALLLEPGDLLYNRTNSAELVGKTGIFKGPSNEYSFASYLIRIRLPKDLACAEYVNLAMNAPEFRRTQIDPHVKQQCGQANVNGTVLKSMLIPLPPLAEQHRIVAKVDELLALCDTLKAQIADSRKVQRLLAVVLIDQTLAA